MKIEKTFIIVFIILFIGIVLTIKKFTAFIEKKSQVYVQGAFYIDKNNMYKIVDSEMIEKMLKEINPHIIIFNELVTYYDNLFGEFENGISPVEKDSINNIYLKRIKEISGKLRFDIIPLGLWEVEIIHTRRSFYNKNKDNPDFKIKVESYKKLNSIISKKIDELKLNENILSINSSTFDNLKEIEGEYFSSLFGEELSKSNFKYMNKKHSDKIREIIRENRNKKMLIIYDSNQKYELVKELIKIPGINVIRMTKHTKNKK